MPLFWRVFTANAAALALATLVLVISPATVSFPVAATEAVVLVIGLCAMLALNWVLLRRAFAPLLRLKSFMRGVDPLTPGRRAPLDDADPEVAELTEAFNDMIGRLEAERRDSARRTLAAQEGERLRLARDLHDEVGQALTGVMLQLDQAVRGDEGGAREAAAHARDDVRRSLDQIRQIARRLRPEALDLGLSNALAALTTDIARQANIQIRRKIATGLPQLAPESEVAIYRVAQEALTNVARHAGATQATLTLEAADGALVMSVRDDGRGVGGGGNGAGAGVRGMRERAVMIGAQLRIEQATGGGTEVRLTVPVDGAGP